MENRTSKFQIIVLAIFIVAIIGGVIAFATYKGSSKSEDLPEITIWGTFPNDVFRRYIAEVNNNLASSIRVEYTQKSPDLFTQDFVSALARGLGPDAILIPADRILPEENKLTPVPYKALSQRDFMDAYIQEAQVYLTPAGSMAIPFTVDPIVMYWNRDMYNAAGLATYPRYWDEFADLNKKLTVKDQNGNVRKSALALGTFSNVTNAREVLGTLFMQTGNPVTIRQSDGLVISALGNASGADPDPALAFFSQFADPSSANYSWNRGMQNDKISFLGGTLATYFGLASELSDIRDKNPNLNFDVAPIPQARTGGKTAAYGRMYGFSIVRASPNQNAAYQIISILTEPQFLAQLSMSMYLPSVLNSLNQSSSDPYIENFNRAALIARTWLDADPVQSRRIFGTMVDSIVSGQKTLNDAVQDAADEHDVILRRAVE